MINLMILITHHKHQYLFICMWSKLRMFDFLENEIYILSVTEGVSSNSYRHPPLLLLCSNTAIIMKMGAIKCIASDRILVIRMVLLPTKMLTTARAAT